MNNLKIDDISKYYNYANKMESVTNILFWFTILVSLSILFHEELIDTKYQNMLEICFIVLVIMYSLVSKINDFFIISKAERMRCKQLLSNSFDTNLSDDNTHLYYNNEYLPSINKLGANTMENSFFSKEIISKMLIKERLLISLYTISWVVIFAIRDTNMETLIWITQFIFSSSILVKWINLEILRFKCEEVYESLRTYFYHNPSNDSAKSIAIILDSFTSYESAKYSAGCLLNSKVFNKLNPELTEKWDKIKINLNMNR